MAKKNPAGVTIANVTRSPWPDDGQARSHHPRRDGRVEVLLEPGLRPRQRGARWLRRRNAHLRHYPLLPPLKDYQRQAVWHGSLLRACRAQKELAKLC